MDDYWVIHIGRTSPFGPIPKCINHYSSINFHSHFRQAKLPSFWGALKAGETFNVRRPKGRDALSFWVGA